MAKEKKLIHKVLSEEWDAGELLWFEVQCGIDPLRRPTEAAMQWEDVTCPNCKRALKKQK